MSGLYDKFRVERRDGRDQPAGDRANAKYFVLDYVFDPYARIALQKYIDVIRATNQDLADDLQRELDNVDKIV